MKNTNKNFRCPVCESLNFSYAKFCGNCGSCLDSSVCDKPETHTFTWIKKKLEKNNFFSRYTAAKFVGVLTLTGFLAFSVYGKDSFFNKPQDTINWGEAKSYFSEKLQITGDELDYLFARINKNAVSVSSEFDLNKLLKLQSAIQSRLRQPNISLFPNPYFDCPEVVVNKKDKNISPFVFCDIPLDHPVYKSVKPLFDIGVDCGAQGLKFRPYDRLTWAEWNDTLNQLGKILTLPENYFVWKVSNSGFMNNIEFANSIKQIKNKLGLKAETINDFSERVSYPSRIECFSSLASVIAELLTGEENG
jgi:hypothetical protein